MPTFRDANGWKPRQRVMFVVDRYCRSLEKQVSRLVTRNLAVVSPQILVSYFTKSCPSSTSQEAHSMLGVHMRAMCRFSVFCELVT